MAPTIDEDKENDSVMRCVRARSTSTAKSFAPSETSSAHSRTRLRDASIGIAASEGSSTCQKKSTKRGESIASGGSSRSSTVSTDDSRTKTRPSGDSSLKRNGKIDARKQPKKRRARRLMMDMGPMYMEPYGYCLETGLPKKVTHHADNDVSDEDEMGEMSVHGSKGSIEYHVDFVLSTHHHPKRPTYLAKWNRFRYPTWVYLSANTEAVAMFERRRKMLSPVLMSICKEHGIEALDRFYPNIRLHKTSDDPNVYIKLPGVVYSTGLHNLERQWQKVYQDAENTKHSIYIEDWTGFEESTIPDFQFSLTSVAQQSAEKVLKTMASCDQRCACDGDCTVLGSISESACCSRSSLRYLYTKNGKVTEVTGNVYDDEGRVDMVECGDDCTCTNTCHNRVVQRGPNSSLLVFRHPQKGWSLRTLKNIARNEFVIEYVGIVYAQPPRGETTYQVSDRFTDVNGKEAAVVVDALKIGNESRFISHSCSPNLHSYRVEISGSSATHPQRRIAFFSTKDIEAGEELTFDYFGSRQPDFDCRCGEKKCRFKKTMKASHDETNSVH